jgi:hypothetical protein
MITYQGSFKDYTNDNTYRVTIITNSGFSNSNVIIPIIDKKSDAPQSDVPNYVPEEVYFSPDPVHITCERSDLTQLIMITQCQIKLKTNKDLSDILFANTNRDIKVKVERMVWGHGDWDYRTLFYGYVDPLQFEQGYAHNYEEITINATDPLGALEQLKIDKIDTSEGDVVPVMNIIYKIFDTVFASDASAFKGIKTYMNDNINPNGIKVNLSVFYGDSEDDYMTLYDTLYELLKYLGCTICYEPEGKYVNIYNLYNMTNDINDDDPWFDAKDDAMDSSGSLSKDDAYSQIKITCEIEPNDEDIDLIDSDLMYSDYSNYQKYMTELVSPGEGDSAYSGFKDLLLNETTDYEAGYKLDHYCYVKRNDAWDFGDRSYITYMNGSTNTEATDEERKMKGDQSDVLRYLKNNSGKAAFVSFGKGNKINYKDNSPVNNIGMTDYLVISINGHNDHGTRGHISTLMQELQSNSPICKYNGLKSVNITPTDKDITNYIVISGKMILNPLQRKTGPNWEPDPNFPDDWHDFPSGMDMLYNNSTNTYSMAKQTVTQLYNHKIFLWHRTVWHPDNGDGAYYTQKWWKDKNKDPRNPDYEIIDQDGTFGYLDNKENEMLKYSWTSYGNEEDKVSKLPIFICELKIGDKYCVEMLNLGEKGQGVFKWMTYDEWNSYDAGGLKSFRRNGFDRPYFTIGIDPKVDDKLIGHSFNIQNNISYTMNINGTGTAIPIKITDKLNGVPEFTILGVMNHMWNEIERVHPTLFRSTSWNDHLFWTLELLDSILISDFKIEFKSDNALYSKDMTNADNDLVYVSDLDPRYTEILECDLKICTPLTMDECLEQGIKYQTSNSYVMTINDDPFYGWGSDNIKPEQLLIDYLYKQYKEPARKIKFCVDNGKIFGTPSEDGTTFNGFSSIISQNIVRMKYPGVANKAGNVTEMNYYCMSMDWSLKHRENSMTVREMLTYTNPFGS